MLSFTHLNMTKHAKLRVSDQTREESPASLSRSPQRLRRNINGVLVLAAVAKEHAMELPKLLSGSGITPSELEAPLTTLTFEQEFRLIRNLLDHCGDRPGLGCEVGAKYRSTSLASFGFALVSGPSLRSAFDILLRYAELNTSILRILLADHDGDLHIEYAEEELPPDLRRFAVERASAVAWTLGSAILDRPVVPKRWDVTWDGVSDDHVYRRFCGIEPTYGRGSSVLVLSKVDVDASFAQSNPLAFRLAEENCRQYLASWRLRTGIAAAVRDIVSTRLQSITAMGAVASELHMSVRTLRRRLDQEGVTYSQLCDEIRQALAEELLAMHLLPVEQIAERLGYAEPSSFIHAFRRWTGHTPTAFRRSLI
jgi:AraC-like DNA-binding protein